MTSVVTVVTVKCDLVLQEAAMWGQQTFLAASWSEKHQREFTVQPTNTCGFN